MVQGTEKQPSVLGSLDWWTVGIYLALLTFGWLSVCGASYTFGDTDIFSLDTSSGKQMVSVHFQGKPFNIMIIQVYAPNNNAEEAEAEWFYEDLQDFLELTPKKRYPLHCVLQGQISLLFQVSLDSLLLHSSPL